MLRVMLLASRKRRKELSMRLLATTADICSILGFLLAVAMALWDRVKGAALRNGKKKMLKL